MSNAAPGWTKENVALLNQFLEGGTGQLFLHQISAHRPSLLTTSNDPNAVALAAQLVGGYERAIAVIQSLSVPTVEIPKSESEQYIDLETPPTAEESAEFEKRLTPVEKPKK